MCTKIYLITGFLGSGKTTFLKNILLQCNEKVGVLINEFGKISIDGLLIKDEKVKMLELNNGSIFCSCIKDNFIEGLRNLIKKNLDYIFIESSGLADPSNMQNIVKLLKKDKNLDFNYIGSICLIDGVHFEKELEMMVSVEKQIKHCQVLLLNKIDLIDENKKENIIKLIKNINPIVPIYETSYGVVDINKLELIRTDIEPEESSNTEDNRPKTVIMHVKKEIDMDDLKQFIDKIKKYCFRIKGFVPSEGKLYKLDAVNDKVDLEIYNKNEPPILIFISSIGLSIISKIVREGDIHIKGKYELES